MTTNKTRQDFLEHGFHVTKGLLTADEAHQYRLRINRTFGLPERELTNADIGGKTFALPDGVTKTSNFWPLIFNARLLEIVRSLLGDDIRYTQHSDLHINLGAGKFHRDSAHRQFGVGPDWDDTVAPYRVVRVTLYLSDYSQSGSSLVVLPGTHRRESRLNRAEMRMWSEIRTRWRRYLDTNSLPQPTITLRQKLIRHQPGDCIIFDQRLIHAGGIVKGPAPKYAIYLSYGLDNIHAWNHHAYYLSRPTYLAAMPADLATSLSEANLRLDPTLSRSSQHQN